MEMFAEVEMEADNVLQELLGKFLSEFNNVFDDHDWLGSR